MTTTTIRTYPFSADKLNMAPEYEHLRQAEPVSRVASRYGDVAWLVTRHEDVRAVLGDPRFSRKAAAINSNEPHMRPHRGGTSPEFLLGVDPPDHTRLRTLAMKAFNKSFLERHRNNIEKIVNEHIDLMLAKGAPADLIADFGSTMPMHVLCYMLGAPFEHRAQFETWSEAFIAVDNMTAEQVVEHLTECAGYIGGLVAERREAPGDDLLSAFVAARNGEDRFSPREVVAMGMFVLVAGFVTTSAQIPKFAYTLLTNPEQLALLRATPDLMPQAVEELMRYVPLGIGPLSSRYATEDVEVGGVTVRAGEPVLVVPNSANQDESAYTNPRQLDLTRREATHLTFGHGVHRCLGAPLARMEIQIALRSLLERLPGLQFADSEDDVVWRTGLAIRGIERMPITWDQ